ncbi:hypothetical protein QIS99_05305 [Streptomyces sp. B-S-A8]|uniref:Uncharacterized protein n=1 Tax=Streptomyces solicavernae TaxID=3043614 RepID=A0ABT6RMH7_9ACTN|nr:hypothetical protein [Streptomyces sp. B-S-A8]MDI3385636.1 hypothetical protein [Streptomyces sp. B-S-A8]
MTVLLVQLAARRPAPQGTAPYATDGSEHRGAVRHYYAAGLKFYGGFTAVFALVVIGALTTATGWLFPLGVAGICGLVVTQYVGLPTLFWTWQCERALRSHPLVFRSPVYKVHLQADGRRSLRLGPQGVGASPVLVGVDPLRHESWPAGIADGVWFAGDEASGGTALVPHTGELIYLRPTGQKH